MVEEAGVGVVGAGVSGAGVVGAWVSGNLSIHPSVTWILWGFRVASECPSDS